MANYTKKELEEFRNDPFAQYLCGELGIDLNAIIDKEIQELEAKEAKEAENNSKESTDTSQNQFVMNVEQFKTFIKDYRELSTNEKKLSYLYGINFEDGDSGFGFSSKANKIIWDLLRIIFGEENIEDIADFVFGTSNFDSEEALYNELV